MLIKHLQGVLVHEIVDIGSMFKSTENQPKQLPPLPYGLFIVF